MTYEEKLYAKTRDELIYEAKQTLNAIYFESAAPGIGYWVFPCGCCRCSWHNGVVDTVDTTCDKHRRDYNGV